ncbi:MAG: APC family permease [Acidimicrobiales bacterium]
MATGELRRALGLRTVASTSAGLAFAAIDYLAIGGLIAYATGGAAWIPILVAACLVLLAWGYFGELNGMFPTAAAIRLYMSKAMGARLSLGIAFSYMTTIVLVVAADAFIIASALAHSLGAGRWLAMAFVVGLLGLATLSNLAGVKLAGRVQDIATFGVLAVTIGVAVAAFTMPSFRLSTPLTPLSHRPVGDLLQAIALGVFLYAAFEWVTTSAEEVRNPKSIARGMLIAIGLLALVCSLVAIAMSGLLDHAQLVSAYPQVILGKRVAGQAGMVLMTAVTAVTALNTFNGGFVTASRFVYAVAREGNLPRAFSRLNNRAVPFVPVLLLAGASTLVAAVVAATGSWQVLVATGACLEAMIYAVAGFCVLRLRKRLPEMERPLRVRAVKVLAPVGIGLFALLALAAGTTVGSRFNPLPLVVVGAMGSLAAAYVVWYLPKLRAAEAARRAVAPPKRRRPSQ